MNLFRLQERVAEGRPVTVGLIGAGKFGLMFLAQARHTPGLRVAAVADLDPDRAPAGLVYSMAYGDQPALIYEMVDWAQAAGLGVVAAGKGTKYLPIFHDSTPETSGDGYGISPERAAEGGMNPQMFNSFLDGTKSAIEMAAVSNATSGW